ncbi:type II toxin-antitoxin system VapC family toxin [Fibrella aquatilis]|uniref:Ribonuclease VapC n=1 Tax=Fibrella aquatilis TaxID=2817059 RepID=A0A939K080_9BACT|nr:type II toxin-antitoxin system VapC family toxin [Fibrella aquatilis]MBO0932198.1 type II toxin-antitoxin system VapC family toxin [Fibrella aquatilis]
MILCDTNIFINYLNNDEATINAFDSIGRENIAIPSIAVMELYRGMLNKQELVRMKRYVLFYETVHVNQAASAQAIFLLEQFRLSHNLQIPDALIGATAITNNLPLFTYNVKDFSFMPGLTLYNPATP